MLTLATNGTSQSERQTVLARECAKAGVYTVGRATSVGTVFYGAVRSQGKPSIVGERNLGAEEVGGLHD